MPVFLSHKKENTSQALVTRIVVLFVVVLAAAFVGGCGATRPSETEVRACVLAASTDTGNTYGGLYGDIIKIEFGKTTTSQGGMMDMGAPKGTIIFPTKIYLRGNYVPEFWVFKDSFGKLQCYRHG
jgi:hypothetical protein